MFRRNKSAFTGVDPVMLHHIPGEQSPQPQHVNFNTRMIVYGESVILQYRWRCGWL